jgi:hypothetical protein
MHRVRTKYVNDEPGLTILPIIYDDNGNLDVSETYKSQKSDLKNVVIDVVVAFILLIGDIELVETEFK